MASDSSDGMNLSPEKKIAGVLAPLFALRTRDRSGIGDLEALRQFIDWAAGIGFKTRPAPADQRNRAAITVPTTRSARSRSSRRRCISRPVRPEDLTQEDFDDVLARFDLEKLRRGSGEIRPRPPIENRIARKSVCAIFRRARTTSSAAEDFRLSAKARAVAGGLRVLPRAHGRKRQTAKRGTNGRRNIAPTIRRALARRRRQPKSGDDFREREAFFRYVQWIASRAMARDESATRKSAGVALMGDIPFGVSYYSADVFARPGRICPRLVRRRAARAVFQGRRVHAKMGTELGHPALPLGCDADERNFAWWRQRVRGVRKIFHVFRIDHVLGFYRIYAFPWRPQRNHGIPSALLGGNAANAPAARSRILSARRFDRRELRGESPRRRRIFAGGSGRSRRRRAWSAKISGPCRTMFGRVCSSLGIAGFKIPQWENYDDGRSIPGSEYQRFSVATYATHDHKPLRAIWEEASSRRGRRPSRRNSDLAKIAEFAGSRRRPRRRDFERDFYAPVMEALFRSESWIAVVMITDLLGAQRPVQRPGDRGRFELEPADAYNRGPTRIEPHGETTDEARAKITPGQRAPVIDARYGAGTDFRICKARSNPSLTSS